MDRRRGDITNKYAVRRVLEDTGQAYSLICETHVNSDYADYAGSQALEEFRAALDDPTLTFNDLSAILRKASAKASLRHCKTPWSTFMAKQIASTHNRNLPAELIKKAGIRQ